MWLEPDYMQNIIVGILFHSEWHWYLTEKELWFLDRVKFRNAFSKIGYDLPDPEDFSDRFGVAILDENTAPVFLAGVAEYKVEARELSKKLFQLWSTITDADEKHDMLDYYPMLFVDFDHRKLYSYYPEPASFEHYVPEGWVGEYRDFKSLVPENQRYWIIGEKNYFELPPPGFK